VKTQIWMSISVYILVPIIRKRLQLDLGLYTIFQIRSVNLFEKVPLKQLFANHYYNNQSDVKEQMCNPLHFPIINRKLLSAVPTFSHNEMHVLPVTLMKVMCRFPEAALNGVHHRSYSKRQMLYGAKSSFKFPGIMLVIFAPILMSLN